MKAITQIEQKQLYDIILKCRVKRKEYSCMGCKDKVRCVLFEMHLGITEK